MDRNSRPVEFSVDKITVLNDGRGNKKTICYVQNCSTASLKIRVAISQKSDPVFRLLNGYDEHTIASGLKHTVILQSEPQQRVPYSGELEAFVDGKLTCGIPIEMLLPSCLIEVSSHVVDFGLLVREHQIVTKTFTIANNGTTEGGFILVTESLPPFYRVSPCQGGLKPKEKMEVQIELLCKQLGSFNEILKILSEETRAEIHSINVTGSIEVRKLELLDSSTQSAVEHVEFGSTYYGTSIIQRAMLYNNSPANTQFVVLLDTQSIATIEGLDKSGTLALACTPGGLSQDKWREQCNSPQSEEVMGVRPQQGTLNPYETRAIEFVFSPHVYKSETGWGQFQTLVSRRDYALFFKFMNASVHSSQSNDHVLLEVAATGTALPVDIQLLPATHVDFGGCLVNFCSCKQLQLCNNSSTLPLEFSCRKLAHYRCDPDKGRLEPGQQLELLVSFRPRQLGDLNTTLRIELLGPDGPKSKVNGTALLRTVVVQLNGCGISTHIDGKRRFKTVRLAHPDDRATSVRPHDGEKVRTRYTKVQRYTYLDPDYAWSPEEAAAIREHKYLYTDFIRQRRLDRDWRAKEAVLSRASQRYQLELGILPADGLEPPHIGTPRKSRATASKTISVSGCGERMATLEEHLSSMSQELSYVQCCSNKAYGANVVSECTAVLVPSQLSQIVIEPTVLDFGCIVAGIPMEKAVIVKNYMSQSFALSLKIDSLELQPRIYAATESHVSMILPPRSCTEIPLVFQKTTVGNFERSLEYTINRHHRHHIPVRACTVPLSLKLSSHTVVLQEPLLSPPGTGLTGSLVMANEHDIPIPFQWLAKDAGSALAFQMTHPTGVVPAKASLFSEFSCQPSYTCPKSTEFLLFLGEGTSVPSASVTLVTQFGKPMCNFHEKRVFFGAVPLNLTTTTSIHLENLGENHAYFQVSDPSPHPGLQVFPTSGCIAAKGTTELTLTLHTEQLGKVDTDITVQLRQGKTLHLKVIGSVQQPILHIDKKTFQFGGVHCGATASCPFVVTNESPVKAELIFDFCFLKDFSVVTLPSSEGGDDSNEGIVPDRNDPNVYTLVIPGKESRHCALQFTPRDVASYDFNLPILVNGSRPPSPPPSPWPPSRSSKMTITSQQAPPMYDVTPTRRVLATALRPPLIVSNPLLNFTISPKEFEEGITTDAQKIKLTNSSNQPLTWALDWSGKPRIEDGTFNFALPTGVSFYPPSTSSKPQFGEIGYLEPNKEFDFVVTCSPRHHGNFECIVPIFLNGNASQPYCMLRMGAELRGGNICVQPAHIAVQPVPLGITLSARFTVCVEGFAGPVDLDATVPSVDSQVHFEVKFLSGGHAEDCCKQAVELPCLIEFSSLLPITLTTHVVFADKWSEKRIRVPVTVAADNSPFTIYEFLANNLSNNTIKLNEVSVPTLIVNGNNRAASSIGPSLSDLASLVAGGGASSSSITAFGDLFLQDSISSACRWLSMFGWPRGRKAISSPTDLRQEVQRGVGKSPGKLKRSSLNQSLGPLLELLTHICGRLPPGIPLTPPPCSTHSEQVNLQYCIYSTILTFLNNQGAQMWCVLPEALLDYRDFSQWRKDNDGAGSVLYPSSREEFEVWSRQAWTHLLMQVIKVLVLPSITAHASKDMVAMDPHSSNVYSIPERVLLAWLNQHYGAHRSAIFGGKEAIDRVATTFDVDLMDCTFLACAMAAYCPFLVDSHFKQMYVEPSTPEQCSHNAQILVSALRDIGLDYDCQTTDLCSPNPILLILFCAHLYHHLPSFKPKTSVCFASVLGAVSIQKLQLENPSSKSLVYKALLRGGDSGAFSVADLGEDIVLQPRQRTEVEVAFRGRHVTRQPSPVTLLLVAKGGRSVAGATLAFSLHATVTGAKPMVNKPIVAPLYQPQTLSLEVLSPFEQEEEFELRLFESNDPGLVSSPSFKRVNTKSTAVIPASAFDQRSTDHMQLFHSNVHTIRLVPGQPALIPLQFVPLRMESRHCSIVLSNGTQGELVLSVAATIKLPYPLVPHSKLVHPSSFVNEQTKTLHLQTYVGQKVQEELVVGSHNPAFEEAIMAVARWGMSEVELKRRSLTGSLKYAALSAAMASLSLSAKPLSGDDALSEEPNKLVFVVEGSGSHFATPHSISVPVSGDSEGRAVLPVTFCAEKEGQYECHLVLRSEYDVRTLVVESTVMALERATELEFRTPAMHPVTQEIPVVNPSTVDWPLKATLTGSGFSGPEILLAAALSTTCYPLTFNPKKEGEFLGQLSLMNAVSGSNQIFHLKGLADRPLAEGYIRLHAQAKRSCTHTLHVPNYNERTTTYEVETDLDFITGPTTITVGGGDIADYPLVLCPTSHGTFTGVVAFVAQSFSRPQSVLSEIQCRNMDPTPHHVWFHFTCEVEPAPPTSTFSITAHALSTEVIEIKIANESRELWNLKAKVEGHGLSGPKQLSIEPNSQFAYQITFTPTIVGREKGRVVFTGSRDGEFWYELDLIMLEPKPVVMPQVVCEVGRNCQQILKLSNPLEHPVTFFPRCTNTKHFIMLGHREGQVVAPPHSTVEVPILFQPSALGASNHTAEVSFSNEQLGSRTFIFHGCGVKPSTMEPTVISSSLHTNAIHTFTFTNPLDTPTRFSVSLVARGGTRGARQEEGNTEHFCLLLKRTHGILLHPGVSLDIPVMFAPEDMRPQEAELTVTTEDMSEEGSIVWHYPIGGQPRLRPVSPSVAPHIQCTAKERLEQRLEVCLAGSAGVAQPRLGESGAVTLRPVTPGSGGDGGGLLEPLGVTEGARYRYRLVCGDPDVGPLLEQCTGVRLIRSEESATGDAVLVFGIVFSPSKPFSCNAELHVISVGGSGSDGGSGGGDVGSGGGGVWQFPLHFKATVAAPDDVITVEAKGLHKETQIGFRLTSMVEHPVPFTAYLIPESDPEISVHPTCGELSPVNTRGTLFCVSYKPTTYGKDHFAKLVIQTNSNQWCYEIVGRRPNYSPPNDVTSKIRHKGVVNLPHPRKNFVRENIHVLCKQ